MQTEEKEMTENEKKKEYLRQYRIHVRRIHRINAEIAELRSMKISPSMNNDGMPHGSSVDRDLSGYVAEKERLEKEIEKEKTKSVRSYVEIMGCINKLQRERERDVLYYRYVKEMEWWDVTKRVGYSQREVYRTDSIALRILEIPKSWQKMSVNGS